MSAPRPKSSYSVLIPMAVITALAACAPGSSNGASSTSGSSQGGAAYTGPNAALDSSGDHPTTALANAPFTVTERERLSDPWAISFVPDSTLALITEKRGALKVIDTASIGKVTDASTPPMRIVSGMPNVDSSGQGGLGDVLVTGPARDRSIPIYLSWSESVSGGKRRAVVASAYVVIAGPRANLRDLAVIWRQNPAVTGAGHYSHRLTLSPDGKYLFVTSGDRQKMDPAQDPSSDLGKVIRIDRATGKAEHWSLGHRNLLGIAFDADGRLWETEMGPAGGDELNLIQQGGNYGWPRVSNGTHYDGRDIPDHKSGDGFIAPKLWWNPSISPAGLHIYQGDLFPAWKGDAFIPALSGESLIRADLSGDAAHKAERWDFGARIRAVREAPDGSLWLLEDGENARLLELRPKP